MQVYTSLLLAALPVDIAAVMPFTKDNELCVSLMLFGQVRGSNNNLSANSN